MVLSVWCNLEDGDFGDVHRLRPEIVQVLRQHSINPASLERFASYSVKKGTLTYRLPDAVISLVACKAKALDSTLALQVF